MALGAILYFTMKNKGFWILFGVSIALFLFDLISTLINFKLIKYLEYNQLVHLFGLFVPILFNLLLFWFFWWCYKKPSFDLRFNIMFVMVLIILTRITVIINNFSVYMNPPEIAYLESLPKEVLKTAQYQQLKQLYIMNILPFFAGIITWIFYKLDHKIEIKDG